ncbi:MAG: mandelate racemase/muconate lactonizing enzyme family protein [Acidobacteriaceae bacterium]
MKIADLKVYPVAGSIYNWILLEVITDSGLKGVGEATNWPGGWMVVSALEQMKPLLIGEDPNRIDAIWNKLYKHFNYVGIAGVVVSALSGIDIALWDLKAKSLGTPIYNLLGGRYRDKLLLYANGWFLGSDLDPDAYARAAELVARSGFTGMKCDPFRNVYNSDADPDGREISAAEERRGINIIARMRESLPEAMDIAVDTHARFNAVTTVRLAQSLAQYRLMWYEEPVPPENTDALRAIRSRLPVPIAVGERLYTRQGFRPILEGGLADYLLPDVTRTGGISEMIKIAAAAETYYVPVSPHNPNGPISTLAAAHAMTATPNFHRLEFWWKDAPWRDSILSAPLCVESGHLILSDAPGLGVDLNVEECLKHPAHHVSGPAFYV